MSKEMWNAVPGIPSMASAEERINLGIMVTGCQRLQLPSMACTGTASGEPAESKTAASQTASRLSLEDAPLGAAFSIKQRPSYPQCTRVNTYEPSFAHPPPHTHIHTCTCTL